MNVSELARQLKVTPQELRYWLPQYGFDIGFKAIKLNANVANKIIREWPKIKRRIDAERLAEQKARQKKDGQVPEKRISIDIPKYITVRDFAGLAGLQLSEVLSELMKNGIFASLNEKIDFDTAWLVGSELGVEVMHKEGEEATEKEGSKLRDVLAKEDRQKLSARPPVIVVMGHVDHGKTKLLDAIRKTDVAAREAGGITQHIGAYQVEKNGQEMTFIDTPGHEAFTAMRSRGARIADIAILVVAADDGVKPQTVEAFKIIEAAQIPYVVAINKIDKPDADINRVKQELSQQLNITPEDWGGKTICAPISALKGEGIAELLDMVLLVAETESDKIKANPGAEAIGTIIESNVSKGAGPIAMILVQNGTLRLGDQLVFNGIIVGKVRGLDDYRGAKIESALPSMPAQIIGLKNMPQVGDILEVGEGEKVKHKKFRNLIEKASSNEPAESELEEHKQINIVIKSDVLGSAEAIGESLEKINTKEVRIKILFKGLGNVSEGDLKRAEASQGKVIGFNVKTPPEIAEMAREKNIEIKNYRIIYDLINDIKAEMKKLVVPKYERRDLGRLKVLKIFRTVKGRQIVGGKVIEGQIEDAASLEIFRSKELSGEGKITKLQAGKQNVTLVGAEEECGLEIETQFTIAEGDVLAAFKQVQIN